MEAGFVVFHILNSENALVHFKLWWHEDLQSLEGIKDGIVGLSE